MIFKIRKEDFMKLIDNDEIILKLNANWILVPSKMMPMVEKRGVDVRMKWLNYIMNVNTNISAKGDFFVNGIKIGNIKSIENIEKWIYEFDKGLLEISYFIWVVLFDLEKAWEMIKDDIE